MRRIFSKIFLTVMTIVVTLTIVLIASYAWVTMSTNPGVNGMTISVGGGVSIQLAADVVTTDTDGNKVHSPGAFSSTLDVSEIEEYLSSTSLRPVSTADGIYWILPTYDETTFELNDISEFEVDSELEYANNTENGYYAYMDFWVLSPSKNFNLRVSTDKNTYSGSYLIELPDVVEDSDGNLQLDEESSIIASSSRIGFLVNTDSCGSSDTYSDLRGNYDTVTKNNTTFTIYEPNGTLHSGDDNGKYFITKPLGYDANNESISQTDIDTSCLTVQTTSTWNMAITLNGETASETAIYQQFKAAMTSKDLTNAGEAKTYFYGEYLGSGVRALLSTGTFFENTSMLYYKAGDGSSVSADDVATITTAGASNDGVIVSLEKNIPQRIRMFFWIEGEDVDCESSSSSGKVDASSISLSIELAGSDK